MNNPESDARYRHMRPRPRGQDLLPAPAAWTARAVCAAVGTPADWSPDPADAEAVDAAIQACGHCPVRTDCLEDALERPKRVEGTIRGGMTDHQRRKVRRARTRQVPAGRTMEPALEATRIVRTLAADGHPTGTVEREARVSHCTLTSLRTGTSTTVASDVAARLRTAYQRMREWEPAAGPHTTRTRRRAAAAGWATSAAWQGLDMADPAIHPNTTTTAAAAVA